jgi:succinyldiaminopimelate transaminase
MAGFNLPDFPWDLLAPYADKARRHLDGAIDLSQGTPVDPTPSFIQSALAAATNSPSYPVTIGSKELRAAIESWLRDRLSASGEFDYLPTIGSKELVAWLPTLLGAELVLYPEIAYPTYLVGAILARAQHLAVPLDVASWPANPPANTLIWLNTPSNPTGRVHSRQELAEVLAYSRAHHATLVVDECYLDFPANDSVRPISMMEIAAGANEGLLVVHSLSKRSNLAGYRAGLIAGDRKLIKQVLEIRKHAGMMVPLPIQSAMALALSDQVHVNEQAARYAARRQLLASALERAGFEIHESAAGLYIWCTRGEEDWRSVDWLAELGIIATPGRFYGELGNHFIRVALTASDQQIQVAAARISAAITAG